MTNAVDILPIVLAAMLKNMNLEISETPKLSKIKIKNQSERTKNKKEKKSFLKFLSTSDRGTSM